MIEKHCKPFRADPERICEWPGCTCHAEFSCCYCEGHLIVGKNGDPIYHDAEFAKEMELRK